MYAHGRFSSGNLKKMFHYSPLLILLPPILLSSLPTLASTPSTFFPQVSHLLETSSYSNPNCGLPSKQKELRLDHSQGKKAATVTSRLIDQGQVGDCYAAAATCGIESAWNGAGIKNEEISYLSSAIQTHLAWLEENTLNVKENSKIRPMSRAEKIKSLETFLPSTTISLLTDSELDALIVTQKAYSDLKDQSRTSIDGLDACSVIKTINEEGYCPLSKVEIEKSLISSRLNKSDPLSGISEDSNNLQGNLINAVEKLYVGIRLLKTAQKSADPIQAKEAEHLLKSWVTNLENLGSPHDEPSFSCQQLADPIHSLKSAMADLKKLSEHQKYQDIVKAGIQAIQSPKNESFNLKQFLLSALVPNCDTPEKRIKPNPALTCQSQGFPNQKVIRYADEVQELRKKRTQEYLGELWDENHKKIRDGVKLESLCKQKFIEPWGQICNSSLTAFVDREEFIQEGLRRRSQFPWLTAAEKNWIQQGNGSLEKVNPKGILSNKIVNINEIANEFDQKVTDRLKQGLPMGVSLCSGVLQTGSLDGKNGEACVNKKGESEYSTHAVQIIGVRKAAKGCQYLVKDSRGPNMSYSDRCADYVHKLKVGTKPSVEGGPISQACEAGLIWVPSEDLSINTRALYQVNSK